jgi:hypothetical protein
MDESSKLIQWGGRRTEEGDFRMPDDTGEVLGDALLGAVNTAMFSLQGLHGLGLERRFIKAAVGEAHREGA